MKRIFYVIALTGFCLLASNRAAASASFGVGFSFGFFYSSLSPHGEWIEVESGMHIWRPHHMNSYWRPYMNGQWIWTDNYGWYWMSDEPFGWVTYHYGRWYYDDYYGWVWVPDDLWGPAWVEWRYDNDYIGWAPLPPYAAFSVSIGIHFTHHWAAPDRYWNFVHYRSFGSRHHYRDMVPQNRVRRIIGRSRGDYRYSTDGNRIINRGIDRSIIERRGRIHVRQASVMEERKQSGERMIRSGNGRSHERIEIYRPTKDEMNRNIERVQVRRGDRALSLDTRKVERSGVEKRGPAQTNINREQPRNQRSEKIVRQPDMRNESRPRVVEPKEQSNKQERRRELIQRHENRQNPSPPLRQDRSQRYEKQRSGRSGVAPNRSTNGNRSERSRNRR